ncbi:MAG: ATP-binding protein, partial [Campylobacterota bacterium]|nr:ATP-binding protein [Campylobacterota bacterium]
MRKIFFYLFFCLITTLSLSADADTTLINLENLATEDEDFTLWIALFGLGAVGLIALFLSSEQMKNFKQDTRDIEDTKNKMNQTQDQILSNMGENIQNIAQETVATAKKLATNSEEIDISSDLERVVNSESKLLAITTNLIEFLRIKSKKVEIVNEKLKLSNLLNDVSGTLKANTKNIELELIYDIKSNIPENLNGDTLNLSKVLVNLLLFCVENSAKEIRVKVSKNSLFNKDGNIYFSINSDIKLDVENSDNIFNSNYNEETNSYNSLGLFIARELSTLMGGELIARNNKNGHMEFLFNIPFEEKKQTKQTNSFIDSKTILIVDSSYNSAIVIKEIFLELKHKAKVISKENYLLTMPDFSNYDIVVIDEKLFTKKAVALLKKSSAKVISLNNLFKIPKEFENSKIADIQLNKPLTKKQIIETMEQLYLEKSKETVSEKNIKEEKALPVYKKTFEDTLNIELNKFAEFRGTNVLLVEDNLINQKVLIGVLSKSGMNITVANDGQEA